MCQDHLGTTVISSELVNSNAESFQMVKVICADLWIKLTNIKERPSAHHGTASSTYVYCVGGFDCSDLLLTSILSDRSEADRSKLFSSQPETKFSIQIKKNLHVRHLTNYRDGLDADKVSPNSATYTFF